MPIGDIRVPDTRQRARLDPVDTRGGPGDAIAQGLGQLGAQVSQLASAQAEIENAQIRQQQRIQQANAETAYARYVEELENSYQTFVNNYNPEDGNLAQSLQDKNEELSGAFRSRYYPYLTEEQKANFETRLVSTRSVAMLKANTQERAIHKDLHTAEISSRLLTAERQVFAGLVSAEDAFDDLSEYIDSTFLSVPEKKVQKESIKQSLLYTQEVKRLRTFSQTTRPTEISPSIAALKLPESESRLLQVIAQVEGGIENDNPRWYSFVGKNNVWDVEKNGIPTKHPGIVHNGSTAFGAFQIIESTWNEAVKELAAEGVFIQDLRPENQVRVALHIAEKAYARYGTRTGQEGINLLDDLRALAHNEVLPETKARIAQNIYEGLGVHGNSILWLGIHDQFDSPEALAEALGVEKFTPSTELTPTQQVALEDAAETRTTYDTTSEEARTASERDRVARESLRAARIAAEKAAKEAEEAAKKQEEAALEQLETALKLAQTPNEAQEMLNRFPAERFPRLQPQYARAVREAQLRVGRFAQLQDKIVKGQTVSLEEADSLLDQQVLQDGTIVSQGLRNLHRPSQEFLFERLRRQNFLTLPPQTFNTMEALLASGDPQKQDFAIDTLIGAYNLTDGGIVHDTSDQRSRNLLQLVATEFALFDDETARVNLRQMFSTELQSQLKVTAKAFSELDMDEVLEDITDTMERLGTPALDVPGLRFAALARQKFQQNYALAGGDESKAVKVTAAQLKEAFKPSPVGGGYPMLWSPLSGEIALPGQNRAWVKDFILKEVQTHAPLVENPDDVYIVTDAQTLAAIEAGKAPSYAAFYRDSDGMIRTLQNPITGELVRIDFNNSRSAHLRHEVESLATQVGDQLDSISFYGNSVVQGVQSAAAWFGLTNYPDSESLQQQAEHITSKAAEVLERDLAQMESGERAQLIANYADRIRKISPDLYNKLQSPETFPQAAGQIREQTNKKLLNQMEFQAFKQALELDAAELGIPVTAHPGFPVLPESVKPIYDPQAEPKIMEVSGDFVVVPTQWEIGGVRVTVEREDVLEYYMQLSHHMGTPLSSYKTREEAEKATKQ